MTIDEIVFFNVAGISDEELSSAGAVEVDAFLGVDDFGFAFFSVLASSFDFFSFGAFAFFTGGSSASFFVSDFFFLASGFGLVDFSALATFFASVDFVFDLGESALLDDFLDVSKVFELDAFNEDELVAGLLDVDGPA